MPPKAKGIRARFEGNHVVTDSGCWEWTKCKDPNGYGRIQHDGRAQVAHRIAWALWVGPIPKGMCVLHKCDNPTCINPDHLFLGTQLDNIADMNKKGRHGKAVHKSGSSPMSKLAWPDILSIRKMRREGMKQSEIALAFGVTTENISMIVLHKTWKETKENGCPFIISQ